MEQSRQPRILVVEDDPAVSTVMRDLLQKEQYEVRIAATGHEGLDLLQKDRFDLLVLDLGLPDMDGLDLCAQVRKDPRFKEMPVFILSARGSSEDIVKGLETGAEDYLSKPFNERELLARVQVIFRRQSPSGVQGDFSVSGRIKLSLSAHQVWVADKQVYLTSREFDILRVFLAKEGKALTREEIVKMAWGPTTAIVSKVVDVHVGHLRAKLGVEGKRIETIPQVGYKLETPKK